VLRALALLKRRRKEAIVVASGATTDYRHAEHFSTLTGLIRELGLQHDFRLLGVVPYEDLLGLMQACIALLNPSLFEGWSTTVEEAKSLGKLVVLSGIPVHVEQKPERSLYFDALSAEQLADRLAVAADAYSPGAEKQFMDRARAELPGRVRSFALAYEDVALRTAAHR
jgi:glycosyltransferase involved in cell wall biosynthesis